MGCGKLFRLVSCGSTFFDHKALALQDALEMSAILVLQIISELQTNGLETTAVLSVELEQQTLAFQGSSHALLGLGKRICATTIATLSQRVLESKALAFQGALEQFRILKAIAEGVIQAPLSFRLGLAL